MMPSFNSIVRAFASLGHDLECSSCGTLYTRDCVCSMGTVEDKILVPKPPKTCARCTRCGNLVDGPNCHGCALLRQKLEENLVAYSLDFQNTSEPSNASTNVVNAPREPNSGVETLISIPSESEGIPEHACDVPFHDNSLPLNVLKDTIEDFSESNEAFSSTDDESFSFDKIDYVEALPLDSELVSSEVIEIVIPEVGGIKASNDNPIPSYDPIIPGNPPNLTSSGESDFFLESLSDEDVPKKIYSNPFFDEEIIPMEIDPHSFNAESDLIESMPNNDYSIIIPSKIDSLFDEFAGELTLLKSIPPGIDETDCHLEEEIRLTNRLLYDNSSPHPPEEIVSDNSNDDIKSFSPSPILIKDSDSHMEEIDLSLNPDEPNSRDFTKDVVEDISPTKEPQVLNTLPTHPTLQLNLKFSPSSESLFAYVV
nr:hypothetical protein [Tanacetum cinerariifolium]